MEIVRMKLTPDDISSPRIRYNAGSDTVEMTPDEGTTWVETPTADPRFYNQSAPLSGGSAACDAATRMTAALHEVIDAVLNALNSGAGVAAINGIIFGWLAVFALFSVLVGLVALVTAIIVAFGYVVLAGEFSGFDWHSFECKLRCYVNADGQLDQASYDAFRERVTDDYTTVQAAVLNALTQLTGFGALNAFAATRTETGDCDDCDACEWCWEWSYAELVASPSDWTHALNLVYSQVFTGAPGGAFAVHHAEMDFTWNGLNGGSGSIATIRFNGTNYASEIPLASTPTGTLVYDGAPITLSSVLFGLNTASGSPGVVSVTRWQIRGTGAVPAFNQGHAC